MYDQRRLTDRQAAMIILSDQTERTLAKHYGLSRQAINHIRSGKSYANVYQQLLPLLNKETEL
jgi:DNA-binding XRE family transcriptional regulator